ncbi:hypothetical protein Sango_2635700 [Sesamum angolense]|uniref:Hydrophobic seed protein domain-containing protein n=1 Tax=Sesamum angolense TaxID=2727404 RepID=A0AAE1W1S4_9LAMI|nr:hypothetical protein Sango_2635700 [Sesamum angolense]
MALVTRTLASATLLVLLLLLSSLVFSFASRPVAQPAPLTKSEVGTHGLDTEICFDLFQHLMHWSAGKPTTSHPCCSFICSMVDYEAASSLCYTFKSNFLGMQIDYHKTISMVMDHCGLAVPRYFKC